MRTTTPTVGFQRGPHHFGRIWTTTIISISKEQLKNIYGTGGQQSSSSA
jgi:hypothetical protein